MDRATVYKVQYWMFAMLAFAFIQVVLLGLLVMGQGKNDC